MPRVEFESREQKERFDRWINEAVWKERFVRGAIMPLGGEGQGFVGDILHKR